MGVVTHRGPISGDCCTPYIWANVAVSSLLRTQVTSYIHEPRTDTQLHSCTAACAQVQLQLQVQVQRDTHTMRERTILRLW